MGRAYGTRGRGCVDGFGTQETFMKTYTYMGGYSN
jgi:hypothetical protein